MTFIVTIVHVFVSFFLMLTVLLQAGKGGGMGATFGGGSSQGSVFGGSGAGNFLSRLTTVSAVLFMSTSMTLAYLASTTGEDSLKKFSAGQRSAASQKKKLDAEATQLNKDTMPDGGLVDELDPSLETGDVDSSDGTSDVEGADVEGADVEGADVEGADVEGATGADTEAKETAPKPASKPVAPTPAAKPKPAAVKPKPAAAKPKPAEAKPKPAEAVPAAPKPEATRSELEPAPAE